MLLTGPVQGSATTGVLNHWRSLSVSPALKTTAKPRSSFASQSQRYAMVVYASDKVKVAVTGASGKTGKLVFEKLLARADKFEAVGIFRSEKSASSSKAPAGSVAVADIATGQSQKLEEAMKGCEALVICTSAMPQIKPLSLIPVMWAKFTGQQGVRPDFTWKENQNPEQVDWLGQKVQIDAAKSAGVAKVILVSSMGGTDVNHPLNSIGNGNILVWKRKAEEYLMSSGLTYTIIHPGGLIDQAGGERELIVDVDDKLLKQTVRSIPRADVAELCVQCITLPQADNRSFDVISKPPGEGTVTNDFAALLDNLKANCDYNLPAKVTANA